jgi:hypothetical protein
MGFEGRKYPPILLNFGFSRVKKIVCSAIKMLGDQKFYQYPPSLLMTIAFPLDI